MTDHMTAAMEAGAKALEGHLRVDSYLDGLADRVITAAEPHIRAMIAQEIEEPSGELYFQLRDTYQFPYPPGVDYDASPQWTEFALECFELGITAAAQIAKGPQQ